ncbi:hypothetical protein OAN12_07210 [Halioglobus sp.]|nr:hypothetical protein [Halioglobus sp.]
MPAPLGLVVDSQPGLVAGSQQGLEEDYLRDPVVVSQQDLAVVFQLDQEGDCLPGRVVVCPQDRAAAVQQGLGGDCLRDLEVGALRGLAEVLILGIGLILIVKQTPQLANTDDGTSPLRLFVSIEENNMAPISIADLNRKFDLAENGTKAIRIIEPYYNAREVHSEINTFIVDKTVQHFRKNNKPDGIYRLGHGLELVLGEDSEIWEEAPF